MSIETKIIAILAEQAVLEPSDIALDDTLEGLGIDSLALVETIFSIEEEFDISVPFNANDPDADEFDITSVASVIAAVKSLMQENSKV